MRRFLNFMITLLGLNAVILVHELGHFLMCKLFDVRVPVFSVGFGPKIIGYKIGNTLFQLALLPLGGYNSIDPASLATKTYIQKMIINLAGIGFNIIFAFILLLFIAFMVNRRKMIPVIATIFPGSPADQSDLVVGDIIIAIDHKEIENNTERLINALQHSPGKRVIFTVERNGLTIDMPVTLSTEHPLLGPNIGWLGATFKTITNSGVVITSALYQAALTTYIFLIRTSSALFTFWRKKNQKEISGPIGIISAATNSFTLNIQFFTLWLAIININVAIFNLLPIPLLDGGHVVKDTIEAIYGAPIPANIMQLINLIFLLLFILLIISVSARDIHRIRKKNNKKPRK